MVEESETAAAWAGCGMMRYRSRELLRPWATGARTKELARGSRGEGPIVLMHFEGKQR